MVEDRRKSVTDRDQALIREIYSPLRRFAAVVGPAEGEPDDLVQEALSRVLRRGSLAELDQPMAYILWGSKAKAFADYITNPLHKAFMGGHPSPKAPSANFFCKNYFNCANDWLESHGTEEIDWNLADGCEKPEEACIWSWDSKTRSSS